jgi:transposase-like protein/IS1 family transposase
MTCPHCKLECIKFGFFGRQPVQRYRCRQCRKTFADFPTRPLGSLKTPLHKAIRITDLSVEGVGVRAIARLTHTNQNTVQRVLEVVGSKCAYLMDQRVRNAAFAFVQVDELFCFVGCKEKNNHNEDPERGRQSVFLGVDADSKFIINWMVGKRNSVTIEKYMQDLKLRVKTPFQLTTDGFELFEDEVKWAFYGEARYGQVTKKFVHPKGSKTAEGRYEPSRVGKIYKRAAFGSPWLHKISTSYIDRTHLSLRLFNRRFTRLTLGFSKKLANLKYSVALFVAHFNFCRVHGSLQKQTPAMAAGLTDHVWSVAELLTESGNVGSTKWVCPLHESTVSPPIAIFQAA